MKFSFKFLFAIWSLSPQWFHYYFFLSSVSWQYQKYSTILILVLCLLCVTPLVSSSYTSLAPSSPFFSGWLQKDCDLFTNTLVFQHSSLTSWRQPQTTRVSRMFPHIFLRGTESDAEMWRAYRVFRMREHTEVCKAVCPGGLIFWREYSRRVYIILQNSRQNPKISKISKRCLILIDEEISNLEFLIYRYHL